MATLNSSSTKIRRVARFYNMRPEDLIKAPLAVIEAMETAMQRMEKEKS